MSSTETILAALVVLLGLATGALALRAASLSTALRDRRVREGILLEFLADPVGLDDVTVSHAAAILEDPPEADGPVPIRTRPPVRVDA